MRLLLINNNPAVSKLINLSAEKLGYEIEEISDENVDLEKSFDITITDSDSVEANSFLLLKETGSLGKVVYIGSKGVDKPEFADYFLQKPFLPTDFVELLKKIGSNIEDEKNEIDGSSEEISQTYDMYDTADDIALSEDNVLESGNVENELMDGQERDEEHDGFELDDLDVMSPTSEYLGVDKELYLEDSDEDQETKEDIYPENTDAMEEEEPISTSILDSEEINQVKQLLEDEDTFENEEVSEEDPNNVDTGDLSFVSDHEDNEEMHREEYGISEFKDDIAGEAGFENPVEDTDLDQDNDLLDETDLTVPDTDHEEIKNDTVLDNDEPVEEEDTDMNDLSFAIDHEDATQSVTEEVQDEDEVVSEPENEIAVEDQEITELQEDISEDRDLDFIADQDYVPEESFDSGDIVPSEVSEDLKHDQEDEIKEDDITEDTESFDIVEERSVEESIIEDDISGVAENTEKSSIDDLVEEDMSGIFEEDIVKAKEELESAIKDDVKRVLSRDEIKEAMKGFKINISITIDEL